MKSRGLSAAMRCIAALMACALVWPLGNARSAPGDIFTVPAPVLGADPPKAAELKAGDLSVATATGAVNYSYPISVPPGRNGLAPKLALVYSSQAPTYGGVAAGWSLPIGMIREDTSGGRLRTHDPAIEANQSDPRFDDEFVSTIAGEARLVPSGEPAAAGVYRTYRVAYNDATFARYERMNSGQPMQWRVRTTDGTTMLFGESALTPGCANDDGYARLTRVIDAFGNEMTYSYVLVSDECVLSDIVWGQNPGAALPSFARVHFDVHGPDAGSQTSYRTGQKVVTGKFPIVGIVVTAYDPATSVVVHQRTILPTYTFPTGSSAPIRLLTSIQESAFGVDSPLVTLPPVTFEYGDPVVNLSTSVQQSTPWALAQPNTWDAMPNNLGWGYRRTDDRWPTIEAMMVDLDGDGLQDRMLNASTPAVDGLCKYKWQRNLGKNPVSGLIEFGLPSAAITLPRLKWKSNGATASTSGTDLEGCSLNGQVTVYQNANGGIANTCHNSTACVLGSASLDQTMYCNPGGTECPPGRGGGPGTFRTQLAYRWTDIDGDGLTDLIAGVHGWIGWYDLDYASFPIGQTGPEPPPFGAWPACPGAMDRCAELDPACIQPTCTGNAPCTVNPQTVNACLAAAHQIGCNHLIRYPDQIFSPPPGGGIPATIRAPYTRCEGLYPWVIYKNLGNGTISTTATIKYMPVPLEAEQAEANFSGPVWSSQRHAVMDFDGDGRIDLVIHPRGVGQTATPLWWWYVWLGDGTGGVEPTRHTYQTRIDANINGIGTDGAASPLNTEGLIDINGDGLLDHWMKLSTSTNANVAINDGTKQRVFNVTETGGEITTPLGVRPANDAKSTITNPVPYHPNDAIITGDTVAANRVLDVDGDGRADVAIIPPSGPSSIYFNVGGNFSGGGVTYPGAANGLQQRKEARQPVSELTWAARQDVADLDGDGIAESAALTDDPVLLRHVHSVIAPPRLLTKVKNGRGLELRVSYGHMHDTTTVEQHPELTWPDGRPKTSPQTQWVVKQLVTDDEFAALGSTTSYFYRSPRHGADDRGRYAFRGFDEVITTAPTGAKTIERYAFDTDWSGRLIRTLAIPAEAPSEVRSIKHSTWVEKQLFGGAVRAILGDTSKAYTCANGQSESQCIAAPAAYSETQSVYSALSSTTSTTVPLLWAVTTSTLRSSATPGNGDRRTVTTYALAADTTNYRLKPLIATRDEQVAGNWVTFAKSGTEWDPTYRVPAYERVWVNATTEARTYFTYDMTSGLLFARRKPVQGQTGPALTYNYDSRKLFAATETNELGHVTEFSYEYGTGTKLETRGPNVAADSTKETHRIRVDGMGRTIEELASISLTGSTYGSIQQLGTTAYVEANVATLPHTMASVTTVRKIAAGGTASTQQKVELDGHARPKKTTVFVQGSAPADHVTTYTFGPAQTLLTVTLPDPTLNSSATVDYTYTYDSLNRPLTMRRPDSTTPSARSGVDMTYDGVTKTTTEFVGAAGGQIAATKTIADAFGRILQVHEQTGTSTWAITTYTYAPDDNVATIVDPGGVTTALTHDFANRRTQIARHGRTWKYGYDLNGNMTSEQVPGSTGVLTDPDYTTTTVYDAFDRPSSRVIGQRALSTADQQAFGSRTEVLTYDAGANAKGRLVRWETFAPSATTAMTREDFTYDALGNRTNFTQTFNGASYTNLSRSFYRETNLIGGPTLTRYQDALGGTNTTESTHIYDARGLPARIDLVRTGEPNLSLAAQTRNVAGLVTLRRTDTTGTMTYIESAWSYDKLGRVASQLVRKGPTATQVARQDLTYFGNDDPSTLVHAIGPMASNTKNFTFTYDRRHQLATANETTTTGYFTSSYGYGSAGRFTNVNIAQPTPPTGSEVKPRNVDYVYGDADPERVTALNLAGTSTRYATYAYDAAGNQTSRCYGAVVTPTCAGESMTYVYDGNDQLRRVTRKVNGVTSGSEDYFYGGTGQRFGVVERDAAGAKTKLRWFIGDTEAHYTGANAAVLSTVFTHMSLGTPVARVKRTGNTATAIEFQFHGLANNTLVGVSDIGGINVGFWYTPFGEILGSVSGGASVGPTAHRRRMNDKEDDAISGLAYYGARYSDKVLIAWTQADPLYRFVPDRAVGMPRRANLFVYTLNNSLRYLDPDGRDGSLMDGVRAGVRAGLCKQGFAGGCEMDGAGTAVPDNPLAHWATQQEEIETDSSFGVIDYLQWTIFFPTTITVKGIQSTADSIYGYFSAPANAPGPNSREYPSPTAFEQFTEALGVATAFTGARGFRGPKGLVDPAGGGEPTPPAKLSPEAEKGIRTLERRIAEHQRKLADFKKNPTVRPGMEGQPSEVIAAQQAIRIQKLEREIQTLQDNIAKYRDLNTPPPTPRKR